MTTCACSRDDRVVEIDLFPTGGRGMTTFTGGGRFQV